MAITMLRNGYLTNKVITVDGGLIAGSHVLRSPAVG